MCAQEVEHVRSPHAYALRASCGDRSCPMRMQNMRKMCLQFQVPRSLASAGAPDVQEKYYYLRSISIEQSLAYPPRLAVDLGSYVDGEAHGWARQPYGYFDPAPCPRDIIHTYSYVPTAPSGAPHERVKAR